MNQGFNYFTFSFSLRDNYHTGSMFIILSILQFTGSQETAVLTHHDGHGYIISSSSATIRRVIIPFPYKMTPLNL